MDLENSGTESGAVSQDKESTGEQDFFVQAPSISLPKGGGAVRGIGEKFSANPVTGTGSLSVPIATSPGRAGFGPQLSLNYDSGAGNGPFGLGWNLSLPSITRKTDKGLPRYLDAEASDEFILSGAEDLVPLLEVDAAGQWIEDTFSREVDSKTFKIQRYRPRVEGLFARIEKWTNQSDASESFWRSITRDNVTTWYGKTGNSRIANPSNPIQIFSWLICESYDDKGNVIRFDYKEEDSIGINLFQAHEKNRGDTSRSAKRYIKKIRYGNKNPRFADITPTSFRTPGEQVQEEGDTGWLFEVAFDYGEHDTSNPTPGDDGAWIVRNDPYSSYRSGFEIRTYRLCQRVLMFHHFLDEDVELDAKEFEANYLVRSTDFNYRHQQDEDDTRNPIHSVLISVTQNGYRKNASGAYIKRSMPPVKFEYNPAELGSEIKTIDPESLENLPGGVDGSSYQWLDLNGEGLTGVLTEQAGTWFYKPNESTITREVVEDEASYTAKFTATNVVDQIPNGSLAGGARQFMDLAGNGRLDLVQFARPLQGFYERTFDEGWQNFQAFKQNPNINWQDPNLKFFDVTGDGHADIVISEENVITWYGSLAEEGFDHAKKAFVAHDEELGPRIIFADATETIFQTDLSGDGLTDIARIRNGEVCYWPNLGYGKFGAKVTMDNAPTFDTPDQFNPKRIRLADIDGSGLVDIIYLGSNKTTIWFNQSGNAWSDAQTIDIYPAVDNLTSVVAVDLLGNGTACLVWSSPLLGNAQTSMRYIELMAKGKPHLLTKTKNNLGAETEIHYAPSTYFYLKDKQAGTPWLTKLPFPVHVVVKTILKDKWQGTRFATSYSYHHGYFDGVEREFRGFGRVEQVDSESYGEFTTGNTTSPYVTDDQTLYQPPVKTVTWYHTGAMRDHPDILDQYSDEYFPNSFSEVVFDNDFVENTFPNPDLSELDLSSEELREAARACKGMVLRQETYELDVNALQAGDHEPVKLFSSAYHNCNLQKLQPQKSNKHAVFLVTESEAITYNYELALTTPTITPDPRVAHTLNLTFDQYGNALQSIAVVYPRKERHADTNLPDGAEALIHQVQAEMHIVYNETSFTNDLVDALRADGTVDRDNYRLPLPCEVKTYEITGVNPDSPDANNYFTLDQLKRYRFHATHQPTGESLTSLEYHELANRSITPQPREMRIVEHVRMLYFNQDLRNPLPFAELNHLGLPYETYKLALTDDLLAAVFRDKITPDVQADISDSDKSGYLSDAAGQYWLRSGIAGFAGDAADHFYLPEEFTDAFSQTTSLSYDKRDLYIKLSEDALGNTTAVTQFDYRVLAPCETQDVNNNFVEVKYDTLGLPIATAVKGKGSEADNLDDFTDDLIDLDLATRINIVDNDSSEEARRLLGDLLGNATSRFIYDFGERLDGTEVSYGRRPASAASVAREQHASASSPLQISFAYSDGNGNVLVTKAQAEPDAETPDGPLRWIANGKTILNNKGKPVKQYEPYFSEREINIGGVITKVPDHRFEELEELGVTPIIYYDSAGRVVRTDLPDGSYSRAEFSPWHATSYDQNDTVLEAGNVWHQRMSTGTTAEQRAASIAAKHENTPSSIFLDSLGREVISVAFNRTPDNSPALANVPLLDRPWLDEKHVAYTKLDTEGKPLWIEDARHNLVMRYTVAASASADPTIDYFPAYDIAGNLLFQHSMDAGDRWLINDASGQPFYAWDENERASATSTTPPIPENRIYRTQYDELRRPLTNELQINGGAWQTIERMLYGEALNQADAQARNLRGQLYQHYDPSGVITSQQMDFKGNALETTRQLTNAITAEVIDWPEAAVSGTSGAINDLLQARIFTQRTQFDALNRMVRQENWHYQRPHLPSYTPPTYIPQYNQRGVLESEELIVNGEITEAIKNIGYDEKGQRQQLVLGNDTVTNYIYDALSYRLTRLSTIKDSERFQDLHYTYDAVGNIAEIRDDAQQTIYFRNSVVEPEFKYVYDALYRLIQAQGREHATYLTQRDNSPSVNITSIPSDDQLQNYTETYHYDAVGNILNFIHRSDSASAPGWNRFYQYALDSNRLLATSKPDDDVSAVEQYSEFADANLSLPYRYDTHGSMLNLERTDAEFDLHWDYRDMIHHVNLGGGGQAFYNYDSQKQRTHKRIERYNDNIIEERFYLGGMELYRRTRNGVLVEEIETYHLFATDDRVLMVENVLETDNQNLGRGILFRYQYSNHLGSVGLELNSAAEVISYEEYHPYGTTAYSAKNSDVRAIAKRYRYTGMERDEETGLSYHTARYYLPWLGRWGSSDPIGVEGGVNLYCYVNNNSIVKSDKNGRQGIYEGRALRELVTGEEAENRRRIQFNRRRFRVLRGQLEDTGFVSGNPARRGESVQQVQNAAQTLVSAFKDTEIVDQSNTVLSRMQSIIEIAQSEGPGGDLIMTFRHDTVHGTGDTGFRREFQDLAIHPGSGDQIGHFLGAVRAFHTFGDTLGNRSMVAHEFENDSLPLFFRFLKSQIQLLDNPEDLENFRSGNLHRIPIDESQFGVSYEDLYLTYFGYKFASMVERGRFSSNEEAARFLEILLTDVDLENIPRDDFYEKFESEIRGIQGMLRQFQRTQTASHELNAWQVREQRSEVWRQRVL